MSIFDLSRFMGASLAMIDLHYGHVARDGRQHAVALLDSLAAEERAWTFGGRRSEEPQMGSEQWFRRRAGTVALRGGRSVDVATAARRLAG